MIIASLLAAAAALQPTSKWQVNFDESQCLASREYGTADRPLTLALKGPATGGVIQLAVVGDKGGPTYAEQIGGKVAWGSAQAHEVSVLTFRGVGAARKLFLINLPKVEVAQAVAGQASTVSVQTRRSAMQSFSVSGLPQVMKVMEECVADLRQYWHFHESTDRAPNPALRSSASGSLPRLFKSEDYPADAVRQDLSGQVGVVLLITPAGRVADCTLTETSGIAVLDAQTCNIIRERARYKPAIGLDGKPARDVDHARIRWLMR